MAERGDNDAVSPPRRRGHAPLLLFLVSLTLLALVILQVYPIRESAPPPGEVPLLRADPGPTRERPDDPGGMQVPHQDVTVFNRLEGAADEPVVERLLPPPEDPLPKPAPAGGGGLEPVTQAAGTEAAESEPDPPPAAERPAPEAPPPAAATPVPAPAPAYRVQLGAFRSADDADRAWRQALASGEGMLSSLDRFVVRVDLGEPRGVFHRLQAGPLATEASAESLCEQLAAKNVDCLIVAP